MTPEFKNLLTANREYIIETIEEEVRYTDINVKMVMQWMVDNEGLYNEIGELNAFIKKGMMRLISSGLKHDERFENMQQASTKRQMNSAFN